MGASQRQALTERRAAILAAMGVQVWHLRGHKPTASPTSDSPPPASEPTPRLPAPTAAPAAKVEHGELDQVVEATAAPAQSSATAHTETPSASVQLIHFAWMKSSHGLLAVPLGLDRTAAVFMREVLAYVDWMAGAAPSKTAAGEFRWPQLLDTTEGNPERALAVFFDKHFGEQRPWVGVAEEVVPELSNWLQKLPVDMVSIPSVQRALADPSAKQALWQSLQRN